MDSALPVAEDFQLTETPLPVLVQLGLTYRCNLKCQHCYALYRRDLNEMSLAELTDLLHQLYDAGSCAIVYSHGENLIRKDFHEFAAIVREHDLYQTLMANGFYIRTCEDAQKIVECGVNRVMVSLDSSIPEEHDKNRGQVGAYEIALQAVQLLKQAGLPTVGFSTTIDTHNYDHIAEIVEIAKQVGIDAISFMQNRYNRPGIFQRQLWLHYVQVCRQLYELMVQNRGHLDIYTHDPFMLTLLDDRLTDPLERAAYIGSNICNVASSMVSIDPVGNVTGCNFIEEVIGNVRQEPFSVIWNRLVERYSDQKTPPTGPCSSCSVLSSCMGGCKAFHYNGKYDERCGETRFAEAQPHGLPLPLIPVHPTAPLRRQAGAYSGRLPRERRNI